MNVTVVHRYGEESLSLFMSSSLSFCTLTFVHFAFFFHCNAECYSDIIMLLFLSVLPKSVLLLPAAASILLLDEGFSQTRQLAKPNTTTVNLNSFRDLSTSSSRCEPCCFPANVFFFPEELNACLRFVIVSVTILCAPLSADAI